MDGRDNAMCRGENSRQLTCAGSETCLPEGGGREGTMLSAVSAEDVSGRTGTEHAESAATGDQEGAGGLEVPLRPPSSRGGEKGDGMANADKRRLEEELRRINKLSDDNRRFHG